MRWLQEEEEGGVYSIAKGEIFFWGAKHRGDSKIFFGEKVLQRGRD